MSTVVKDLIIPAHIGTLQQQVAGYPELRVKAKELESKVEKLNAELAAKSVEVAHAQNINTFAVGIPWPVGLENVRIGMTPLEVQKANPGYRVVKHKHTYWTFYPDHGVIRQLAVYFDDPNKPISSILYFLKEREHSAEWLSKKFTALYGSPVIYDDEEKLWVAGNYVIGMHMDGHSFNIDYKATSYKLKRARPSVSK